MHVRLAALIIVIATLVLSFNSPSRSATQHKELTAKCLGNKGRMSDVVAACNTVMETDGISEAQHQNLLKSRGWAYYCGREYEMAIADYSSALAVQPQDATALVRRAFAHDALDDHEAAAVDYASAVEAEPDRLFALYNKAKFDAQLDQDEAALQGFERVLEIDPGYKDAGWRLASVHFELGGSERVNQFLTKARKYWPNEDWVYMVIWYQELISSGDVNVALDAVSEQARLQPGISYELFVPAMIHMKIGDEQTGIEYVKENANQASQEYFDDMFVLHRWRRKALNWLILGQDGEWIHRYFAYAEIGRKDLAISEIDTFLKETGRNGRKIVLRIIRKAGVSVPSQAHAGSVEHLNSVIEEYVGQLVSDSPFSKLGQMKENETN